MTLDRKNAQLDRSSSRSRSNSAPSEATSLHQSITSGLQSSLRNYKKENLNHDLLSYWSAPDYSDMNNVGEDADDADHFSEVDSPKDYCWSAPDLASEDLYESSEESCEPEQMVSSSNRGRLFSLPSSIFSDYDEPKHPSFLALDGREGEHVLSSSCKLTSQLPKSLALEESYNSMDIYVASPSPQRELNAKEVHESFVEKKPPRNSTSPSAIDFIDSPDDNPDIPFGYEHFVAKVNALRSKQHANVKTDLEASIRVSANAESKRNNDESLDNSEKEDKIRDIPEESAVIEPQPDSSDHEKTLSVSTNSSHPNSSIVDKKEEENIEEVLKRFTGFKPYNITNEQVNQVLQTEFGNTKDPIKSSHSDKLNHSMASSDDSNNASSHRRSKPDYSTANSSITASDKHCNDSLQAVSSNETKSIDVEIHNLPAASISTRLLPEDIRSLSEKRSSRKCESKMRRSATECRLNSMGDNSTLKQQIRSGHSFSNGSSPISLKKSNTAVNIRALEQHDASTLGRRRLPVAPNKDTETSYIYKEPYLADSEANAAYSNNNLISEQQIAVQQGRHKSQMGSPAQSSNWLPTSNNFCASMITDGIIETPSYKTEFANTAATTAQQSPENPEAQQSVVYGVESTRCHHSNTPKYTPTSSPDIHFIYHKESQECIPCYGQSCFSSIYAPLSEMPAFSDDLPNRIVSNENNVQRPKTLPFNGRNSNGIQQQQHSDDSSASSSSASSSSSNGY
uniref:Protein aurora borealis n=1 Tax=Syphacia muris TaxID=451379 RepID=A0A0N5AKC4_9BILA